MTGEPRADGGGGVHLAGTVVVPVAEDDDAAATASALRRYLGPDARALVVHVIEKAGGAPDKASVEQREGVADEAFAAFRDAFGDDDRVDTKVLYDTDVADGIFGAADEVDATAIAFTPRAGSRWVRLLTGDVALDLVTKTDRPVLVLPDDLATKTPDELVDDSTADGQAGDEDADQAYSEADDRADGAQ